MKRIAGLSVGICVLMAAPAFAAEPLAGFWQMISQQFGKNRVSPSPMAIRITETRTGLKFDYLVNRELRLQRTFTVKPDGTPAVIVGEQGTALGVARLSKSGPTEYTLVLQRPNSAPEPGTLKITDRGNILHCESDATIPEMGRTHIVQIFSRETNVP